MDELTTGPFPVLQYSIKGIISMEENIEVQPTLTYEIMFVCILCVHTRVCLFYCICVCL